MNVLNAEIGEEIYESSLCLIVNYNTIPGHSLTPQVSRYTKHFGVQINTIRPT
jgi:hypothetical protein